MPSILAYAGSVLLMSGVRNVPSHLILTITLCPIVGATTTDAFGSENLSFSSISRAIARASSFSIFLPALRSVIILSSFTVAKFPRSARSPLLKLLLLQLLQLLLFRHIAHFQIYILAC